MTLTVRINAEDSRSCSELLKDGWHEGDVLVTYVLDVGIETGADSSRVFLAKPEDREQCVFIANKSFPKDKTEWVRRAFSRTDRMVLIGKIHGELAGFVIVRQQPKTVIVDLIATKIQRQGLGAELIWAAWWRCPKWDAGANLLLANTMIKAGTSASNQIARSFYKKLGFRTLGKKRTFHK